MNTNGRNRNSPAEPPGGRDRYPERIMAAKKSGKKGKPLTPRQNAFIKALAKGSTQRDAAIKAGYKAKHPDQAAHQALKQIQGKVPQIMDLRPLVPEFSGLF